MLGQDRKSESIKSLPTQRTQKQENVVRADEEPESKSMRQMEMTETLPQGIFGKKDRYYYFLINPTV